MYVIVFKDMDTASGLFVAGPYEDAKTAGDVAKAAYSLNHKPWVVLPLFGAESAHRLLAPQSH